MTFVIIAYKCLLRIIFICYYFVFPLVIGLYRFSFLPLSSKLSSIQLQPAPSAIFCIFTQQNRFFYIEFQLLMHMGIDDLYKEKPQNFRNLVVCLRSINQTLPQKGQSRSIFFRRFCNVTNIIYPYPRSYPKRVD